MSTTQERVDVMFADGYGAALVARLARATGTKALKAKKVLFAYKQFLVLKAEGDDFDATKLSPPSLVDEMWHLHLLDTRRYQPQCLRAFGRVMHHDPDGGVDAAARAARIGSTHVALTNRFGTTFDKRIWRWTVPLATTKTPARDPPATTKSRLKIGVKSLDGKKKFFMIKNTTPLYKVFDSYSQFGFANDLSKYIFRGRRLRGEETPEEIGMEDGDDLHVVHALRGC
ncbi:small ubiquitin-related modifier protein [Aureococcus anophagefferens]|uniref:Small ubiquitin-related modifier protein n=1 Tax=Aureococcus anophagefferens TaxID=44056 RepID=A0ABR1G4K9_AURAN|nr:hypothetical protein JL722_5073 [Aureococcus anophagefferens]